MGMPLPDDEKSGSAESLGPRAWGRANGLLALGALIGIAIALSGAVKLAQRGPARLPADAVAMVNGRVIGADAVAAAIELLAGDKRNPVTDADRTRVLQRLIDEELLVQHGLDLGLAESDGLIRKTLARSMIESIVAGAAATPPTDAELEAFYDTNRDYFSPPPSLSVRRIFFSKTRHGAGALLRAGRAVGELRAGKPVERIAADLGDDEVAKLPSGPLRPTALREHIGATGLETVAAMAPGGVSDPLLFAGGYQVLQLVDRVEADAGSWEQIRDEVTEAHRRQSEEAALRAYLNRLGDQADLVVVERSRR